MYMYICIFVHMYVHTFDTYRTDNYIIIFQIFRLFLYLYLYVSARMLLTRKISIFVTFYHLFLPSLDCFTIQTQRQRPTRTLTSVQSEMYHLVSWPIVELGLTKET